MDPARWSPKNWDEYGSNQVRRMAYVGVDEKRREADCAEIMREADKFSHEDGVGRSEERARVEAVLMQLQAEFTLKVFLQNDCHQHQLSRHYVL